MDARIQTGIIVGVVILVVYAIAGIVAYKKSAHLLFEYEDIFGTWTNNFLMLTFIGLISIIMPLIMFGFSEIVLVNIVWFTAFLIASILLIIRAVKKCPEELKAKLPFALIVGMFKSFGGYVRLSWNIIWIVTSIIPGLGWTAHFIISKNTEFKDTMVKAGQKADDETQARWARENAEKRERAEEEARRRQEDEDAVRKKAWKEDGRTDVEFSRDGTRWKYKNESWDDAKNV